MQQKLEVENNVNNASLFNHPSSPTVRTPEIAVIWGGRPRLHHEQPREGVLHAGLHLRSRSRAGRALQGGANGVTGNKSICRYLASHILYVHVLWGILKIDTLSNMLGFVLLYQMS